MLQNSKREVGYCLSAALLLAVAATSARAWVNPLENRYLTGRPLNVCDQGSFFVGGVPKVTNFASSAEEEGVPEQLIIGQMYVQFQIPSKRRQWPLIMVHGSGYTGAALDATPDGHEGWFAYAVRNNLATFVVDQAGRGRSGFDRSVLHEARVTGNLDLIPTMGGATSDSMWTSWLGHLIPEGSTILDGTLIRHGDPGDPDPPEDPEAPSEAHGDYPPAYPIPPVPNSIDPNIEARVGAIGPAPNPANDTFLALETYKQLVPNAESTLPGSFCETCDPMDVAPANTWTPLALAELVEGLGGAIVSPHSQAGTEAMHMVRILKERGTLHLLKGVIVPESGGVANLASYGLTGSDFDHIPLLVVNGDYRPLETRQGNYDAVAEMNASPTRAVGPALVIDLDAAEFGGQFEGTTHMMMLGPNNLEVFDLMLDWASENIPNPIATTLCQRKVS
jgi:hypothetical protein